LILYLFNFRYLTTSYGTGQDIDERIVEGTFSKDRQDWLSCTVVFDILQT